MSYRKYNSQKPNKLIFIFTEGEKTEVNYFESKKEEVAKRIRKRNIQIKIKGKGFNTLSLVDFAIDFMSREGEENDECWVVFDKDNFEKDFENAIKKAEANGIVVAYSNECFELWFLLHFCFMTSAWKCKEYEEKLTKELKKITGDKKAVYSKSMDNMYSLIKSMETKAIKHAKKILEIQEKEKSITKKNPSTTVFLLVERLNSL